MDSCLHSSFATTEIFAKEKSQQILSNKHEYPQKNIEAMLSQCTINLQDNNVDNIVTATDFSSSFITTAAAIYKEGSRENKQQEKRVRFSNAIIHSHPIIVGDNPGGNAGPPLTIAWERNSSSFISIDKYEKFRRGHRRDSKSMIMPSSERQEILLNLGFTMCQISKGVRVANRIRSNRRQTMSVHKYSKSHEILDAISRKIRHVVTLGTQKRKERAFLEKYVSAYNISNYKNSTGNDNNNYDKINLIMKIHNKKEELEELCTATESMSNF